MHIVLLKVSATTKAVKEQYQNRKVIACLELYTYGSLNAEFLEEYKGALDTADGAVVFYFPHAVKIKQLEKVSASQIAEAFLEATMGSRLCIMA